MCSTTWRHDGILTSHEPDIYSLDKRSTNFNLSCVVSAYEEGQYFTTTGRSINFAGNNMISVFTDQPRNFRDFPEIIIPYVPQIPNASGRVSRIM